MGKVARDHPVTHRLLPPTAHSSSHAPRRTSLSSHSPPRRNSRPGVTPLPLIDSKHLAASHVPVAKLRRHLITSASGARAMQATAALGAKTTAPTASRPVTAAVTPKPHSGKYERSRLYGSSAPSLGMSKNAAESPRAQQFTHELSDNYMMRCMKQVCGSRGGAVSCAVHVTCLAPHPLPPAHPPIPSPPLPSPPAHIRCRPLPHPRRRHRSRAAAGTTPPTPNNKTLNP